MNFRKPVAVALLYKKISRGPGEFKKKLPLARRILENMWLSRCFLKKFAADAVNFTEPVAMVVFFQKTSGCRDDF
jgi:hypothetical protein